MGHHSTMNSPRTGESWHGRISLISVSWTPSVFTGTSNYPITNAGTAWLHPQWNVINCTESSCFQNATCTSLCCEAAVRNFIFSLFKKWELFLIFLWQAGGKKRRDRCTKLNSAPVKFQRLTKFCWHLFLPDKLTSPWDFADYFF